MFAPTTQVAQRNNAQPGMHSRHCCLLSWGGKLSLPAPGPFQKDLRFCPCRVHTKGWSHFPLHRCAPKAMWERRQPHSTARAAATSAAGISANSPECALPSGTGNWVTGSCNRCKISSFFYNGMWMWDKEERWHSTEQNRICELGQSHKNKEIMWGWKWQEECELLLAPVGYASGSRSRCPNPAP